MHPESTPTWLIGPDVAPSQRIGTILSGSYRLDAFLGQGMTGVTYNAWHLRQKQPYAVKLLHRELAPSHDRVVKLRQDLRALSGLRKFGFLPVELSFAPDGAPFLASELLIGETLRTRLSRGPLPSLAAGIVAQALARALGEAHKAGIVHGDLRPENVLLPTEAGRDVDAGQPVLMDAALHHLRKRPIGLDESLPLSKLVYLAPEQASGEQQTADTAGDLFALGALLYESLTGHQAFAGPELEVILEKLAEPPKKLVLAREVGAPPGLAAALDQVIARACARDPEERYQSMAEFLKGLATAYTESGLPLPPPDERVSIDTVQAQNRALRKRTVAVKRVLPSAPLPDAEVVDPSKVLTAAAMPLPGPDEIEGDADTTEVRATPGADKGGTKPESTVPMKRNTAKQRVLRPTRRARDLSKLVAEIEAGRLTPEQAMAMAQSGDDNSDSDEAYESTDEAPKVVAEQEQLIADGRAAVLARAEEAKRNREQQLRERQAREKAEAQEMQRRLLDQARAETLGRMRAEWEQSRAVKSAASEGAKSAKSGGGAAEAVPTAVGPAPTTKDIATQQSELLAEAQRQAQRLEEERIEAERRAAEEAERARKEAEAAEASRKEADRLAAERREVEQKEAERAERMRQKAEREAEARQRAEAADQERQAKQAEVEAAERAAQQAQRQAEDAQRQAEEAKQAVETEEGMSAWEDGLELLVEDGEGKKPPPPPAEALRDKSEAARLAEEAARTAREQAEAAAEAAQRAKDEAASIARAAEEARRAKEAAEASRIREASEFASIIAAAEEARAREQALKEQIFEAELRARMAEQASVKEQARATRATQALVVIRQVENLARRDPISEEPTVPVMLDEAARPQRRTAPPPAASSVTPLVLSQTTQQVAPPEPSASYAAFQVTQSMRGGDASGSYTTGQLNASVIPDASGGYSSQQIAAAAMRQVTGMTGAQSVQPGAPLHPMGGGPSAPMTMGQLASGPVPGMHIGTGNLPILPGSGPVSMVQPVVVMPTRPADAGGFHFTTRSLVGTLGMTSVLSGVIGSLLTLLVLRSQQSGVTPQGPTPSESDSDSRGERGQARPVSPPINPSISPPSGTPSGTPVSPSGAGSTTPPAASPPTSTPTPVLPIGPGATRPGLRPSSVMLPPLRLASEQPTIPARPSQWLLKAAARPGQPGTAAQPGAKPDASLESQAVPDSKPAPEAKPPTDSKPAAKPAGDTKPGAKPGGDAKPGAKPEGTPEDGLRNPFGR